jgi:hypothetical protein
MAYRLPPPSDFRCGRYPAAWAPERKVTTVATSKRFEIIAGAMVRNTNEPGEALHIARFYANAGAEVSVRDRSKRRGYLTEIELERVALEGSS